MLALATRTSGSATATKSIKAVFSLPQTQPRPRRLPILLLLLRTQQPKHLSSSSSSLSSPSATKRRRSMIQQVLFVNNTATPTIRHNLAPLTSSAASSTSANTTPTTTNPTPQMSDPTTTADEDAYTHFLTRSSQPPPPPSPPSFSQSTPTTLTLSGPTPQLIHTLLTSPTAPWYISDTESPFEPVTFPLPAPFSPPTEQHLRSILSLSQDAYVRALARERFDPRGEYEAVLNAVAEACDGTEGVAVWEVRRRGEDDSRVEYYILGVAEAEGEGKRLVGVRAKAVET